MQASLHIIQTATRVLSALTNQTSPNPADVAVLFEYDGGDPDRDLDELACDVIQKAIRHRAQVRGQIRPQ